MVKLNYLDQKELEKFIIKNKIKNYEEKSKITESQELLIKTNSFDEGDNKNQNVIEIKHENLVKVKEDILCQKEGENEKSRFAKNCKKRNILSIKQKIRIAQSKFETNNNILVENNTLNGISFLYDFYNNLKKKENQIFDITSNLSSKSAINLYFTGEKNEVMIPLNKNKYKKSEENEDKKRMKLILEDSYKSQNVDEIKDDLKNINLLIENNINSLQHFQKKSFDFIEDYGEFFNIEKIIKEIGLTIPLNISDIYKRIKEIESISIKTDLYEKCFYICHIYAFLYFEEFIDYYKEIKEKIKHLNLENIFLLNEAKNYLLEEAKNRINSVPFEEKLFENVWEGLRREKKFVENSIIDKNMKDYVKNKNVSLFQDDLCKLCGEKIKDINLNNNDPQNIFLKPFMEQNDLYYEMK